MFDRPKPVVSGRDRREVRLEQRHQGFLHLLRRGISGLVREVDRTSGVGEHLDGETSLLGVGCRGENAIVGHISHHCDGVYSLLPEPVGQPRPREGAGESFGDRKPRRIPALLDVGVQLPPP